MTSTSPDSAILPTLSEQVNASIPCDHVLLITLNRPRSLNAMTPQMEDDLRKLLNWYEEEPSLWAVVVTGEGRAFCAGADLKAWNNDHLSGSKDEQEAILASVHGFGSLSRRVSSKPIIAAVNGGAYGGGVEILLNCDLVIASQDAVFALPEVKRGVIAAQGGIPRLRNACGHQRASEMLLLGRNVSAEEAAQHFGFVNTVVPKQNVLQTALDWAQQIVQNSPDAVQSTKRALVLAGQHGSIEQATQVHARTVESKRAYKGENIQEGLRAFSEKRKPCWTNPAKL
ncbi:enoyl-CoA hydratase/carnithine racemase [Stereum hirsutum FP-91666 SS1]|uniref:enoyl-CoA hydratase/carnithine racemase n=1 Tax=Stereum hirsutum (strain FP-91666) TaxID=721885 RepID=UPI000440D775|nr:enoyl-CoA hydratase/carnithine racemase [Stereum hirsutum FP-91666 SS1]EIM92419.1 enoyl-CoA hydratase/carnithine racemase [Stereum hirsutum FP-91666 SS1]